MSPHAADCWLFYCSLLISDLCWVCTVLMRLTLRVISPHSGGMAAPKAIYSFNGSLMRFVLYLPVSNNLPVDSDEAELFICSSWYWYRCVLTHLRAELPAPMWTRSGCKVRNFRWTCRIMQNWAPTCWVSPPVFLAFVFVLMSDGRASHNLSKVGELGVSCMHVLLEGGFGLVGWWWHLIDGVNLEETPGRSSRRRVGHTDPGQIKYAWRRGWESERVRQREREREGEEKTVSRVREMHHREAWGKERESSKEEERREEEREAEQQGQALVLWCVTGKKRQRFE